MSADFDIVAGNDNAWDRAMIAPGFLENEKAIHGLGGRYHLDYPQFAVEQVSGRLFDGRADKTRCLRLVLLENSALVLPAIKNMIADRLRLFEARPDAAMLAQAMALYQISDHLDLDNLGQRIVERTGNPVHLGLT